MTTINPKRPTHIANSVREYGEGKTEWIKIGVAWATSNGGFNAQLHALPVDGRIVFMPVEK